MVRFMFVVMCFASFAATTAVAKEPTLREFAEVCENLTSRGRGDSSSHAGRRGRREDRVGIARAPGFVLGYKSFEPIGPACHPAYA
jgi:hypothetical protein